MKIFQSKRKKFLINNSIQIFLVINKEPKYIDKQTDTKNITLELRFLLKCKPNQQHNKILHPCMNLKIEYVYI